jgi:hypothetical protein
VETDVAGLALTKGPTCQRVEIEVVSESFRQDAVRAVAKVAGGSPFDLYLLPDPNNPHDRPHDRNAVRVMVGNLHVGFPPRDAAKVWKKRCQGAMERRELIWGESRAASRTGEMWGIFRFAWMPAVTSPSAVVTARELKSAGIKKDQAALQTLIDGGDPETLSQLNSLVKKATKAVMPLYSHTLWLADASALTPQWEDIKGLAGAVFDLVSEAECEDEPDTTDVTSILEDILELLTREHMS